MGDLVKSVTCFDTVNKERYYLPLCAVQCDDCSVTGFTEVKSMRYIEL
jgi:hypothetical protein